MKSGRQILLLISLFFLAGCPEIEPMSEIPYIEFKKFILEKKTDDLGNKILIGTLTFSFQDGDGDIGLHEPDTFSVGDTTNSNLFFTLYDKINGKYEKVPEDELGTPLNYRIPYKEIEGQNKTMQGYIDVEFEYLTIGYDTIRYSFYLIDRAKHRSNVDTTSEISFTDWKDK